MWKLNNIGMKPSKIIDTTETYDMVICFGYKFSPNMIGIQEGYNKNFHIKCIEYYEKFDSL